MSKIKADEVEVMVNGKPMELSDAAPVSLEGTIEGDARMIITVRGLEVDICFSEDGVQVELKTAETILDECGADYPDTVNGRDHE